MGLAGGSICIIIGVILQASASAGMSRLIKVIPMPSTDNSVKIVPQLVIGRFIIGFASLINGSIAPMWVMELVSPKYRSICSSTVLVSVPFTSFLVACIILGIFDKQSNWAWRGIMLVGLPDNTFKSIDLTDLLYSGGGRAVYHFSLSLAICR